MNLGKLEKGRVYASWKAHALGYDACVSRLSDYISMDLSIIDSSLPDLSGEWAGDPTPMSLFSDCIPHAMQDEIGPEDVDEWCDMIASAWEAGVERAYSDAIEELCLLDPEEVEAREIEKAEQKSE